MRNDWATRAQRRIAEAKADRESWLRRQEAFRAGVRYQDENTNDVSYPEA